MLKDSVDHMHMVEDAEHDRGILVGQPIEILADHIVEATIGPSLYVNELGVRLSHGVCPFSVDIPVSRWTIRAIALIYLLAFGAREMARKPMRVPESGSAQPLA